MNLKMKSFGASALLAAMALVGQDAGAHPAFLYGNNTGISYLVNSPTGYRVATSPTSRGYNEDGIRIAHGCDLNNAGSNVDPVVAVSWTWPRGDILNGWAPLSTGCDATGANCSGSSQQPAVARIPDSSQKANKSNAANAAGTGTRTTLDAEIIEGTTTGAPASPEVPVTNVAGRMQFAGNLGYFNINKVRDPATLPAAKAQGGGFYATGNKFTAAQIAAMGVGSAGAPYQNGLQILWAVDQSTTNIRKLAFSSTSCARKLVVRPAGADICQLSNSKAVMNSGHTANYWMGGPTSTFFEGHGIHENFWLNYTLLTRDTSVNPYPNTCTDQVNGDYDVVVMPTKQEIDAALPFPGFARTP